MNAWEKFRIDLPMPTRANNLVRPAKMGDTARLVKTKEGKAFRDLARSVLKTSATHRRAAPIDGPVIVHVKLFFKSVASDIDGPLKSLFDACTGIVWVDDRQIATLHIEKLFTTRWQPHERVEMFVDVSTMHGDLATRLLEAKKRKPTKRTQRRVGTLTPSFYGYAPKDQR